MRLIRTCLALWLLLAGCASEKPAEQIQDEVLRSYIAAVQDGDEDRLRQLTGPRTDSTRDIDAKVHGIGNRRWHDVRVQWSREFPSVAVATVTAVDSQRRPIRDVVTLGKDGSAWYLSLGEPKTPPPEPPASIGRAS